VPTNIENEREIDKLRDRVHELSSIISTLGKDSAVQQSEADSLKELVEEVRTEIKEMKVAVSEIHSMANRWKGGFLVLAGIGGFSGWVVSSWDNLVGLFKKIP
jgi:hypothetical protein